MKNSVCILWLEGVSPARLAEVPFLNKLAEEGVDIQLTPLPLVEKGNCYYQTLTGLGSGKIGRFDAIKTEKYDVFDETGVPEGASGRSLPDVLNARKLSAALVEAKQLDELDRLSNQRYDCLIVRFAAGNLDTMGIESLLQRGLEWTMPEGHLFVLTDVPAGEPGRAVNINDFLADTGIVEVKEPRSRAGIVWSETLAYGAGSGQVWINLKGREAQGIVRPGSEYQQVRDAVIGELSNNWRDPQTNEPVVERVVKKEDAYDGPYLFKAPDLVVVYKPGYAPSPKSAALDFDGVSISGQAQAPSASAPTARLVGTGPRLVHGFKGQGALVDVMPSVLHLLGQPITEELDGDVLSSLFTPAYLQQVPIRRVSSDEELLSDEEEGMIVDRLRDLGYLG